MSSDTEALRLLLKIVGSSPFAGQTYAVGGFVRDEILGIESHDLDVVVERPEGARALATWLHEEFTDAVSNPHALGAGYPIWQIVFKTNVTLTTGERFAVEGSSIEIADTQKEAFPDPTTRQRVTVYGSLAEDCARRDFTVNMLYRDLTTGAVVDPSGAGLADLKSGVLRGHPAVDLTKIFSDDPLRIVRLARFHARFGWRVPEDVMNKARACAPRVKILSAERVRDELVKIMENGKLAGALEFMRQCDLLPELFPEFLPMIGCGQDKIYHSEGDVWVHTLRVIQNAPATVPLQLAALLHDVGKPATRSEHGERVKFIGHENISTALTEAFMTRYKFGSTLTQKVMRLVKLHLRGGDSTQWTSLKPARKLIREAGEELPELLQLIEADSKASLGPQGVPRLDHIAALHEKLARAVDIPMARKPPLNGREVMELLGIPSGPPIKEALQFLVDLEDEFAEKGQVLNREDAISRLKSAWPLNAH